jgi:hypothetical protein
MYKRYDKDTTFYRDISFFKIFDFAPNVQFENSKVIYCNSNFLEIINQFLGHDFSKSSNDGIPMVKRETKRRLAFLNQFVKIIPGHWGGYYHIESFPVIGSIRMNLEMTEAEVFFTNVYAFYSATLEKVEGNWKLKSSGLMFVE